MQALWVFVSRTIYLGQGRHKISYSLPPSLPCWRKKTFHYTNSRSTPLRAISWLRNRVFMFGSLTELFQYVGCLWLYEFKFNLPSACLCEFSLQSLMCPPLGLTGLRDYFTQDQILLQALPAGSMEYKCIYISILTL